MTTQPIRALHRSMVGSQAWRRPPPRMTALELEHELKAGLTDIALSVFTDCVNSGKTLQDAILAVYLTGIENGTVLRETPPTETLPGARP
jgi:hypothetical protein